jgi:hypothetical protein
MPGSTASEASFLTRSASSRLMAHQFEREVGHGGATID